MPERLRWLRENEPIYWSEADGLWVLTKYADVEYVSKHQEIFTSALGVRPGTPAKIGLIDEGEPRHSQLRRLINRGFTPRMVAKLEQTFLQITTDAIDSVAQAGECDFVTSIAVPLPLMLIAEMMGIDRADYPRFHKWSDDMIQADGSKDPAVMAKASVWLRSGSPKTSWPTTVPVALFSATEKAASSTDGASLRSTTVIVTVAVAKAPWASVARTTIW